MIRVVTEIPACDLPDCLIRLLPDGTAREEVRFRVTVEVIEDASASSRGAALWAERGPVLLGVADADSGRLTGEGELFARLLARFAPGAECPVPMATVRYAASAASDLESIGEAVAAANPEAAGHLLASIRLHCRQFARIATMGRERPELAAGARSFVIGHFIVYYRYVPDGTDILRVLRQPADTA